MLEEQIFEAEQLGETLENWGDAQQLREGFLRLWRRFREDLVFRVEAGEFEALRGDRLWAEMPADIRAAITASGITCGS